MAESSEGRWAIIRWNWATKAGMEFVVMAKVIDMGSAMIGKEDRT